MAIRLGKSDIVDWLVKEIQEKQIQLDIRVKKFLDAHLLSKGLDPLNIEVYENENSIPLDNNESISEERKMQAQN